MIKSDDASQNVVTSLKQLGIVHEILDCDPKFADTLQFCEKYGYPLKNSGVKYGAVGHCDPPVLIGLSRITMDKSKTPGK